MAIRIVTDTGSDVNAGKGGAGNVCLIPMSLTYGDKNYLDGMDIDKETFYKRLLEDKEIPVTSQPSPDQFLQEFKEAKAAGDSVIAILISGALSGTVQSAQLAKQLVEYDEIYIIDSLTATAGMRILVEAALSMAESGKLAGEIAGQLEQLKGKVRVMAVVDTLEYLYKGGRLSRAEAGLGTLANIKPVIEVTEDGKVAVIAKSIGRKRACRQLLEMLQNKTIDKAYPAYFLYSANKENCMNFRSELETRMLVENCADMVEIGATIGTHIGGGAFGIAFVEAV